MTWSEIAQQSEAQGEQLSAEHVFNQSGSTFPFGAHIAVVEVDTETGRVTIIHHVAVDDCGAVLNPVIVEVNSMEELRRALAKPFTKRSGMTLTGIHSLRISLTTVCPQHRRCRHLMCIQPKHRHR